MSRGHALLLPIVLLVAALAVAQTRTAPGLQIQSQPLPNGNINKPYSTAIQVNGATPPVQWKLTKGKLPPGITLQPSSGILSGTPTTPGEFHFALGVSDGTNQHVTGNFVIKIEDYLTAIWQEPPTLKENVLSGSVQVSNDSRDTYDLTVIIVAVNEIGKAFALGYQRLNLAPQKQQVIPYSSLLPNGHYIVHADAVAEIPARRFIRHARLQSQNPITVNVNR